VKCRLVVVGILGLRTALARDVGGQRHLAGLFQRARQRFLVGAEIQQGGAAVALHHARRAALRALDLDRVAGAEAAGVADQRLPDSAALGAVQHDLDPRLAAARMEARGDDAGVVHHQHVAGLEQGGQVEDAAILQPIAAHHQQPRGIARPGGRLGDQALGQVVVEIRRAECGLRRGQRGLGHGRGMWRAGEGLSSGATGRAGARALGF
jgi:hypothetical protein